MVNSHLIKAYASWIVSILISEILLSACSTTISSNNISSSLEKEVENISPMQISNQNKAEKKLKNLDIKFRIMDQYADWKGVRYRLGGNTKKGIDCSAFVQLTFREKFGLELPRSTHGQRGVGKFISRSNLHIGDLILFRSGTNSHHVGIYIGDNQFVHASTSRGVTISSLDKLYWKKRYNEARRVLVYN